jgi:N-acetylglucosaminyl-diphospho-decaprenol L-rhamnosyltransferase
MPSRPKVSISIVSHGQSKLVFLLLGDLAKHCRTSIEVFLTLNTFEVVQFDTTSFPFPIYVIQNRTRKGFGANHNEAFKRITTDTFCVLNPDVRLEMDPFPSILKKLRAPSIGVVAPVVFNTSGELEESARAFPTPLSVFLRALGGAREHVKCPNAATTSPDWVAGMFMVFLADTFSAVGGFDERYFLYYEDVDICWRLRGRGLLPCLEPTARVIHCARRDSHRRIRYLLWHLSSMAKFFLQRARTGWS